MSSQTAVDVAIIATAALAVGWYGRSWRGAREDLASQIKKVAGMKAARSRETGVLTLVVLIAVLAVYVLMAKHR